MTVAPEVSKHLSMLQKLQQEHLEIVLSLTQVNAKLLLARQRASGLEIEVMATERDHAEGGASEVSEEILSDIYAQDTKAKQELAVLERRVEEMEDRMAAIDVSITDLKV